MVFHDPNFMVPPILHIIPGWPVQSYNYSRQGISHPIANSEPYVTISRHTAPCLTLSSRLCLSLPFTLLLFDHGSAGEALEGCHNGLSHLLFWD